MIPIPVPDEAKAARADCRLVRMGPPAGVNEADCGTAEMLIGAIAQIPRADGSRPNYVYFRPDADELAALNAGGFIEFAQYGPVVQPFSAAVWDAGPPREGEADDDVTELGEAGSDSTASQSRDGADSHDVGPVTSTRATPADEEGGAGESSAGTAPRGITTDPSDPRLGHGVDTDPVKQHDTYLVLSDEERAKGFVRPYRAVYVHIVCGTETRMSQAIAETYARQPDFYGATFCVRCSKHLPVGEQGEFVWPDGTKVGT